jgi:hypothetical protein
MTIPPTTDQTALARSTQDPDGSAPDEPPHAQPASPSEPALAVVEIDGGSSSCIAAN